MDYNLFLDSVKSTDADLRPYQSENKNRIYESWKMHNSVMLQMPTGTGKTRLFVSLLRDIHNYAADIKTQIKVLILVHRIELIDQISYELGVRYGLAHGIIHSQDRERPMFPFQIASVQTLNRRLDRWSERTFDFIIVDEAHHVLAESYKKIINTYPNAKVLGVTATPYRLSGAGFRPEFDVLIESESIREFIKKGYLSDYEYYSIAPFSQMQHQIDDITKVDSSGDYANSELMEICDKNKIRAQVVDTYLKYAKGKKGIVYTINKLHNKHLCESFCESGVSAVAIDSDTSAEERERLIQQFKRGEIDVLCNVDIFSEGFDCPDIEFVQLARPTKSLSLYLQQVGRGLRVCEGKEKTIFLDNVGLYNRFGLPADKRPWQGYFEGVDGVIEGTPIKRNKNHISRRLRRNIDLSEGNEKVYLIHSSLDSDYVYERARLIGICIDSCRAGYVLGEAYKIIYAEFLKDKGVRAEIIKGRHINEKNIIFKEVFSKSGINLLEYIPLLNVNNFEFQIKICIEDVILDEDEFISKLKTECKESFEGLETSIKHLVGVIVRFEKEMKKSRIGIEEICELYPIYHNARNVFEDNDILMRKYFNCLLDNGDIADYFNEDEMKAINDNRKNLDI